MDRQILYVHPESQSETICSKIERKDRNKILSLSSVLSQALKEKGKFVFNQSSGRVAMVLPTNTLINEDGGVEERVQLVRPLNSSKMSRTAFADSGWRPIEEAEFAKLWQADVDAAPEFVFSNFYLITGILLPVWNKLPAENVQVCRLQTDDGQKLLGRTVAAHEINAVLERFELTTNASELSPQEILQAVSASRVPYMLKNGLEIKNVVVMGQNRIEIIGFREGQKDILKSLGCITEIIQWRLRLFVPANDNAPTIIERLLKVA